MDVNNYTLQDFRKSTVPKLKEILKSYNEPVKGNKDVLVARCFALQTRLRIENETETASDSQSQPDKTNRDIFSQFEHFAELTYDVLLLSAKDRVWDNDMRKMMECNFHQLYDYLVVKTSKYDDQSMKGSCYKKMKSYKFFIEGHVSNIEVARAFGHVWIKAKVDASMKKTKYRVIIIFTEAGDVEYAACECPAGLGINGCGKCNHIGGLLFAVNHFYAHGLHSKPEKVSCTSELSNWVVPRKQVKPKPIKEIKINKVQFSSNASNESIQNSLYDPRAPQHRNLDVHARDMLYKRLSECAPSSAFFLFNEEPEVLEDHQIDFIDLVQSTCVIENVSVETSIHISSVSSNSNITNDNEDPLIDIGFIEKEDISDDITIDDNFIASYVLDVIKNQTMTRKCIEYVENKTRLQSDSELWTKIHNYKMTSSNFGKVIKCQSNPNSLLKAMLYDNPQSKYLQYGKDHEQDAIDKYIEHVNRADDENNNSKIKVVKAGILLSEERPGYGASLDGFIQNESNEVIGGIECKCPASKSGLTVHEACEDPRFYLSKDENGIIKSKENDKYYLQIQGQLFISKLKYVDFVVWFGPDIEIFTERIYFDKKKWNTEFLPALDFFYKWAFVPEMLTRRVKRGIVLHSVDRWKELKKNH